MIDTLSIRSAYRGKTLPETTIQILCDEIDRLRGEPIIKQPQIDTILSALRGEQQTPPQGKTVQVKVAVGVEPTGKWNAFGWAGGTDAEKMELAVEPLDPGEARFWLTATLPVPDETTVEAKVEGDAPYGYCPTCGAAGVWRERRPNGDDKCSNGHSYPSKLALAGQSGPETRYK